jgi:hypothetical protein
MVTLHANYSPKINSIRKEALLAVPILDAFWKFIYAIRLRRPKRRQLFTLDEEASLAALEPFVMVAVSNASVYSKMDAEVLSGQLDISELTRLIKEKGRQLTNADRCSLFFVNGKRDRLIPSFQRGYGASFSFGKKVGDLLDQEHRLLAMQMLLKVAVVALPRLPPSLAMAATRPFALAGTHETAIPRSIPPAALALAQREEKRLHKTTPLSASAPRPATPNGTVCEVDDRDPHGAPNRRTAVHRESAGFLSRTST